MLVRLVLIALSLLLVAAFAACRGGGDSSDSGTATPTSTESPTTSPTATPDGGDGEIDATPLQIGEEAGIPEDVTLIIETGCFQCDGPTEGLARVYSDASGQIRTDMLFDLDEMGLPPRVITDPKAETGTREEEPFINGFAVSSDASEIIVSVCTRGGCVEPLSSPTPDSETTLFRSSDGGVTWEQFTTLDGVHLVAALVQGDVVLLKLIQDESSQEYQREYILLSSGDSIAPPQAASGSPVALPDGTLIWPTDSGRVVRSDGSVLATLPEGAQIAGITPNSTGDRIAIVWYREQTGQQVTYRLTITSLDGGTIDTFPLEGFARVGGWLDDNRLIGNTTVTTEQLTTQPPVSGGAFFVGYLPAILDLAAARIHPITQPFFEQRFLNGRNHVLAAVQGPFARVVNTDSCLNIRAQPGTSAEVLTCLADGVLLRDGSETQQADGMTWLRVTAPGGVEGWSSTEYLER